MAKSKLKIEDFWGEQLTGVEIVYSNETSLSSRKEIEKISLGFLNKSIIITPINETDEVKIELSNQPTLNSKSVPANIFSPYVGKKLVETWDCTNSQGYSDMYIVGFEYLHPNILIVCEGSALLLFEAHRLGR